MPTAYCPPLMLIGVAALIPEMVMVVDVRLALSAAPVTAVKLNASGVKSFARLLTELLLMTLFAALLALLRVLLAELLLAMVLLAARLLTELVEVMTLLTTLLVVLAELLATWSSSPALDIATLDATTLLIAVWPLDFPPPLPPPHAVNTATNPKIKVCESYGERVLLAS